MENYWVVRIKEVRKALTLSQKELAEELGENCTQVKIAGMEKGATGKHFIAFLKYSVQKGINLNWIFKEDNSLEGMWREDNII